MFETGKQRGIRGDAQLYCEQCERFTPHQFYCVRELSVSQLVELEPHGRYRDQVGEVGEDLYGCDVCGEVRRWGLVQLMEVG